MKILGFYISRTDWKHKYFMREKWLLCREKRIAELELELFKKSETYTDKSGRLRFKHNGQFAPDNRSKFKRTHDQLRAEQTPHWDDVKQAMKQEEFGR